MASKIQMASLVIIAKLCLFGFVFLMASCTNEAEKLYGDLPRYERADPKKDFKEAVGKGDLRFVALNGYAIYFPGVRNYYDEYQQYGYRVISGSTDAFADYEHHRLQHIANFYADHYNRYLMKHIAEQKAATMARTLPGYEELISRFVIKSIDLGDINMHPFSLFTSLSSKDKACIKNIRWYNPIKNDKPSHSWLDLLSVYDKYNREVCKLDWISTWKEQSESRAIRLAVAGLTPTDETMIDTLIMPAWKMAKLKGKPVFEISFMQHTRVVGGMFLDSNLNGVITQFESKSGQHWLDGLDFSYHPRTKQAKFILVNKKGNWKAFGNIYGDYTQKDPKTKALEEALF